MPTKIKNFYILTKKHLVIPLCIFMFLVFSYAYIFSLKIGIFDKNQILLGGFIFAAIALITWSEGFNFEKNKQVLLNKTSLVLFLTSSLALILVQFNLFQKIEFVPLLTLTVFFSGFALVYFQKTNPLQIDEIDAPHIIISNKFTIFLICIVAISLLFKIFLITSSSTINFEKGLAIYDFNLTTTGLIPIKDFLAREPIPMLIEGLFAFLFGTKFYEIPLNIFLYATSGFLLFRLLKNLKFNNTEIILTFSLFYLSTFTLFKLNFLIISFLLFNLIIFFLLIRQKSRDCLLFFLLGLSLILLLHTYRAYISLFIIEILYLYFINKKIPTINELFYFYTPWIAFLYLPSIYFLYNRSFGELITSYQIDKFLLASTLPLIFFFILKSTLVSKIVRHKNFKKISYYLLSLAVILSFIFFNANIIETKIGVLAHFYRYSAALLILLLLGSYSFFTQIQNRFLPLLFIFFGVCLFYFGIDFQDRGPTLRLNDFWQNILTISIFFTLLLFTWVKFVKTNKQEVFEFFYFYLAIFFIISNYYNEWLEGYFSNYFVAVILIGGLFLATQFKYRRTFLLLIGMACVMNFISTAIVYSETKKINTSIEISKDSFNQAVEHLMLTGKKEDLILTTTPWYLIQLNHVQSLNLPHPIVYADPENNTKFHNITTVSEIENLLDTREIKIIIADQRFRSLFLGTRYPDIKTKIENNFYIEKNIGDGEIQIYKLKMPSR